MNVHALSYIDDALIDEIWMVLKRDGIPVERLNDAKAKVSGKAKFGLGHLWNWLIGDLEATVEGETALGQSTKTAYAAPYRLLLVLELVPKIKHFALEQHDASETLEPGDFVNVSCPALQLVLLPRIGDYWHFMLATGLAQQLDGGSDAGPAAQQQQVKSALKYIEKFSSYNRAFSYWSQLEESEPNTALGRLSAHHHETMLGMLGMCNDDLILGTSLARRPEAPQTAIRENPGEPPLEDMLDDVFSGILPQTGDRRRRATERQAEAARRQQKMVSELNARCDTLLATCFEQQKMKLNVAALSSAGRVHLFGRVLGNVLESDPKILRTRPNTTRMITVQPITLSVG